MLSSTRFSPKFNHVHYLYKWNSQAPWAAERFTLSGEKLKETVTKFSKTEHTAANFIDDSKLVIEFDDPTDTNFYIERYKKVRKIIYNDSKL